MKGRQVTGVDVNRKRNHLPGKVVTNLPLKPGQQARPADRAGESSADVMEHISLAAWEERGDQPSTLCDKAEGPPSSRHEVVLKHDESPNPDRFARRMGPPSAPFAQYVAYQKTTRFANVMASAVVFLVRGLTPAALTLRTHPAAGVG